VHDPAAALRDAGKMWDGAGEAQAGSKKSYLPSSCLRQQRGKFRNRVSDAATKVILTAQSPHPDTQYPQPQRYAYCPVNPNAPVAGASGIANVNTDFTCSQARRLLITYRPYSVLQAWRTL